MKKFDKEYSTQYTPEKEFLFKCGITPSFVKVVNPVDFTGQDDGRAEKEYEMTIKRDNIKEEYCRANKIPLIKVPYWELNNMENYIDSEIKKISI